MWQLTASANYRGILDQKQCGVVKCRGREKDGEKLEGRAERVRYDISGFLEYHTSIGNHLFT